MSKDTSLNIRDVDRELIHRARVVAMHQRKSLKAFVLDAIATAVAEAEKPQDKLSQAIPKIAAAARGPLHLQTAATLEPPERTYERD